MTLHGEIETFSNALGTTTTDGRSLAAFAMVGLPSARSDYDLGDSQRTYLKAPEQGAEFVYEDGLLRSVFLSTVDSEARAAYPRPDALIDGLSGRAERDEVRARFGDPEWSSDDADRFQVHEACFVRFAYEDDRVVKISVMRDVPR